ncbi:hypothetical protein UK23_10120 [Lentzea aerocolonigenes]|uniref:OmpR/PhoB-type domain-containing protein n=1 Tax=Lentzea aerocolonigenes TaxID=68170 RepID=A0A0F0H524_LENAE|nr:BTAD domain-containing putative transcriptional regulator [Lentzea aerocolonigenes]KJK50600.1 hypothetical protein UK23_10120 [Lentzea aerocolonigenes]
MLRLLGEVSAGEADLGSPKQRCLLAALAVDAGRVVPVDRLIDRIWGDAAPRRDTVHSYISRLRQAVGGPGLVIERRPAGYVLAGPVDLHLSRELRARGRFHEALELWRGEPLTGLPGEWAEDERGRLTLERLSLLHDLVDTRLRAGEGAQLAAELSSRAAEHPLDAERMGKLLATLPSHLG